MIKQHWWLSAFFREQSAGGDKPQLPAGLSAVMLPGHNELCADRSGQLDGFGGRCNHIRFFSPKASGFGHSDL